MPYNLDPLKAEGGDLAVVSGSFRPNGSSAISDVLTTNGGTKRGLGFSVARTGVGTIRITFNGGRKYNQLNSFIPHLQLASGFASGVQAGAYVAPTATADGYIDIVTFTRATEAVAAAAADIASNANNLVHFTAVFRTKDVD